MKNILAAHGLTPGPHRGEGTWDEFLKMHAQTLWACDFFSKHVWTPKGLVEVFVLFFLHVGTRRVHVTGMSARPNAAWIAEQAADAAHLLRSDATSETILIRDFDGRYTGEFDQILRDAGVHIRRMGPCKPNLNAYAERWVQSIKQECLDRFIVFGEEHLRHIVGQYVEHYNEERPHQARDNLPLNWPSQNGSDASPLADKIHCDQRLGGLLRHYRRVA